MTKSAIILGASGRFGHHAAHALTGAGWHVLGFDRNKDQLENLVDEFDVLVMGWNPAYPDWSRDWPKLTQQLISALTGKNIRVIFPGNLYVYGPSSPSALSQNTPHLANNPMGIIRQEIEDALRRNHIRTIILRSGDFIDERASGNWFDQVITAKLNHGHLIYPGLCNIPHSWAYLPDLGRAVAALAECECKLPNFTEIPYAGYTLSGNDMAKEYTKITGHDIKAKSMNWSPIYLSAPFWQMGRRLLEMRYLWNMPHWLDDQCFQGHCPDFHPTPVTNALGHAVAWHAKSKPSLT